MARRVWTLLAATALIGAALGSAGGVGAAGATTRTAKLAGSHEVPPVATAGTGAATVIISDDGATISYNVTYSGLSGAVVAAHIHLGEIGSEGPIIFPLSAGPSPMAGTLTAANFTSANGLTYAQAVDKIKSGGTYVNLHTAANPGGEIRGQLYDSAAPPTPIISADAPEAAPKGHLWEFTDFFPRTLTVAQGSSIRFAIKGFHTATLLPGGTSVAQDLATRSIASPDEDDTALNPNGTTKVNEHPERVFGNDLPAAGCGTDANPCEFDGSRVVSTGVTFGPPQPGPAIRVTAPAGTYPFHCRVHPAMIGSLTVVAAATSASSPDDIAAASAAQVAADIASATTAQTAAESWAARVNSTGSRTKHLWAGYESPDHHVTITEMIPAKLSARPGDRIVWHLRGRNEVHTVTFPTLLHTDAVPLCEGPGGTDTPATPTKNPPQSPLDFACNGGPANEFEVAPGNGVSLISSRSTVSDSGLLTTPQNAAELGVPSTGSLHGWSVRFAAGAQLGTYHFLCQFHDGMTGVIVVK